MNLIGTVIGLIWSLVIALFEIIYALFSFVIAIVMSILSLGCFGVILLLALLMLM